MKLRGNVVVVCAALALLSAVATGVCIFSTFGTARISWQQIEVLSGFAVALFICIVSVAYRLMQPLRRRLYDLEEAASLIASGRLHHRVQTMGYTDEIGRLAEQFNRMGEQIEAQVKMLQQLAEENRQLAVESERVAVLDERQRLARELHDSVSQQLFGLTMLAASAERLYETNSPVLQRTLLQMSELANAAQREMRALLLQLRPVELEGRSLRQACDAFLTSVAERHQIRCDLDYNVTVGLGESVEEQLFRILQEAIANVLKHAQATSIVVKVEATGAAASLVVMDDGIGIGEAVVEAKHADSIGIRAMRERAASLGGRCEVWNRERGTAVEVHIPIVDRGDRM